MAQCMFGFWTNLLDAGSHTGKPPRRENIDYAVLWHDAFKHAFPGGRAEARAQRAHILANVVPGEEEAARPAAEQAAFTRGWVHGICKNVNELRNRAAHHEPVINGFPLNGQSRRMTAAEGHEQCRILARMIDRHLASWLDANSTVPSLLNRRP